ncbi:pantetheine-phosphate adenylyltransferase [Selenomonas sputigena]|uniref:Phosphopantetheine adenylyltransferase n=1 Tax=Selenomonas sputigena TaxID=69823 RepID=A0ABV3X957_9FIRM
MVRAVCSGSFDPVTNGHIDIFERASQIFDELIVGVFHNIRKKPFFTVEERLVLLEEATRHIPNLRVGSFEGLLPDYMRSVGATVIVRGLRSVTDYEYEQKQEQMLKYIAPDIETVFLLTDPRYSFVSSSGVREIANFHGRVTGLVPECVELAISRHFA